MKKLFWFGLLITLFIFIIGVIKKDIVICFSSLIPMAIVGLSIGFREESTT